MQEILTDDNKSAATHVLLSKVADIWLPGEEESTKTTFMNSLIIHMNYWLNERSPEGQRKRAEEQARLKREREERNERILSRFNAGENHVDLAHEFNLGTEQTRNVIRRWRPRETEEERQAREAHLAEQRTKNAEKQQRNAEIVKLRQQGVTYAAIGKQFGIGRERVAQIWFKHLRFEQRKVDRERNPDLWAKNDAIPYKGPLYGAPPELGVGGVATRVWNCMKNANIRTLEEAAELSDAEWLEYSNFGRTALKWLREAIDAHRQKLHLPDVQPLPGNDAPGRAMGHGGAGLPALRQ